VENSVFHPVQVLRPLETGFKCSVPLNALNGRLERLELGEAALEHQAGFA